MTHTPTNMKIRRLYLVYVAKFKSLNKERICLTKFNLCGIEAPRKKTSWPRESRDIYYWKTQVCKFLCKYSYIF